MKGAVDAPSMLAQKLQYEKYEISRQLRSLNSTHKIQVEFVRNGVVKYYKAKSNKALILFRLFGRRPTNQLAINRLNSG